MINIPWGNDFALKVPIKKKVIQTTGEIEIQDFDVSSVEQLHVFLQHNEHLHDWHSSQVEWSADPENSSGIIVEVSSQMAPIGMYNIILTGVQNGRRFFSQQCRQFKIIGNASSSDLVIYEGIQTYTLDEVIVLDARGRDGLSAYELAVSRGFEGTESEWMATLKGENGNGVAGVELIEQVGNVDHYRMAFTDGTYFDYTVTNSSGTLTPEQIAEIVTEVSQIITAGDLNAYTKDEVNSLLNNKANASDLSSVATSGSYNDLINKPTIPDAQIQSDWNQTNTDAKDYIKNKPNIPQGVTVDNALSSTSENPVQNKVINSALGNKQDTISDLSTIRSNASSAYQKPNTGIPLSDLSEEVQDAIENAGSLTEETDPIFTASAAHGITSSDISNWNGKQSALTFDSTPTASSTNPVTSGGVKTALDLKANQSDTVWNIPQTLGSSQQAQARANIGVVDVSGTNDGTNWTSITIGSTTKAIPSGGSSGDVNVIETVKVNGTALTPDANKAVDVPAVTSFNGSTGAVTYTAPVTSVNGNTGAVTLSLGDTNVIETVKVNGTALTPDANKAVDVKTHDAVTNHGTSDTTYSLTPNVLHIWGEVTSLTLTLATPTDATIVNEYMFQFTSGSTATTLSLPSSVVWDEDKGALTVESGYIYQVSILNNIALWARVAV